MLTNSIFNDITKKYGQLEESDLDEWIVPSLIDFFDSKLDYLACHAYSVDLDEESRLAIRAFKIQAGEEIRKALYTFLFKKQHWRNGESNLYAYLKTVLDSLSKRIYQNNNAIAKVNKLICPLCKVKTGAKEILIKEDNLLRCNWCTQYLSALEEGIVDGTFVTTSIKENEIRSRRLFSLHSSSGYRCFDCLRFIPGSIASKEDNFIVCPYDDCAGFGFINDLMKMSHPSTVLSRQFWNVDDLQNCLASNYIEAENILEANEEISFKTELIYTVIEEQKKAIKRNNSSTTLVQKLLMYDAYKIMTDLYPEQMIQYLCFRKYSSELPIQAKIFQCYVSLIEDYLPFSLKKGNRTFEIVSLTDPELSLFTGISIFDSVVGPNGIILNKTKEEYIGGRNFKNYGPCFIGKIIDVRAGDVSILPNVKEYSFSRIIMDNSIKPDTAVIVSHFRIPSHYEMGSLVFLQRIRRLLVDSLFFRLNGKKRIPKSIKSKD